jgi:glycosyltransferase involved in cell wall biosynthesis
MGKRRKIGILFLNDPGWTGGVYYIINLIYALKTIPEKDQYEISVFTKSIKDFELISGTGYKYLKFLPLVPHYSFTDRFINKVSRTLTGRNAIEKYSGKEVEFIFPVQYLKFPSLEKFKKIYWIPDFQEKYLPQFFDASYLKLRNEHYLSLARGNNNIIFSSMDSQHDFNKFYGPHSCHTFVVNFAVTHSPFDKLNLPELVKKYDLNSSYFFSPNQFWAHKNHKSVLEAIKKLKEEGMVFMVAFSGKESDHRNPDYFNSLKQYVRDHQLESHVRFLGFIDRGEQLKLMEGALAIIQPSLFEGWSTVVEDAKGMNQHIILSNLRVHQEQLDYNVSFFDPKDTDQLASLLKNAINVGVEKKKNNYNKNINKFGRDFISVLEHCKN